MSRVLVCDLRVKKKYLLLYLALLEALSGFPKTSAR